MEPVRPRSKTWIGAEKGKFLIELAAALLNIHRTGFIGSEMITVLRLLGMQPPVEGEIPSLAVGEPTHPVWAANDLFHDLLNEALSASQSLGADLSNHKWTGREKALEPFKAG